MGELEKITKDRSSEELAEKGNTGPGLGTAGAILFSLGALLGAGGCVLSESSSEVPLVVRHRGNVVHSSAAFNKGKKHYDLGDQALKVIDSMVKQGYVSGEAYTTMLYLLEQAQLLKNSSNRNVRTLAHNIIGAFDPLARAAQEGEKYDIVIGLAYTDPFSTNRTIKEVILKAATLGKIESLSQDIAQKRADSIRD
ncbi:hypothetical protein KY360_07380, partial [Candidatus Woesearchaeota archaeon]|nr:hypothetical protein [Candidatus Woesearchaeota archaeon]